jgi:hypothetical protein
VAARALQREAREEDPLKNRIWTGTCTAIMSVAAAAVFAQSTPPQTTSQPPTPPAAAASQAQKVTVTGCLKAAPSSTADTSGAAAPAGTTAGATGTSGTAGTAGTATGTAGTTAAAPANTQYVLEDAVASQADAAAAAASTAGAAAAATGAPATPGASASADKQTYWLIANPAALTPHVGKKLELTGTLENSTGGAGSPAAGAHPSSPSLRVEAGKVIAASCTP